MDDTRTDDHPATPPVTRLADYRPPAWRVTRAALAFDLGVEATIVRSKLALARDRDEPLRLDGEDLELLAARLDGRELGASGYALDAAGITIPWARDGSVIELTVRIHPAANSQLSGLYLSGTPERGFLLTQCEAQGFRRITFFPDRPDVLAGYDVTLTADKTRFPVLIAGGDCVESGDLDNGRHFARFVDPHPKPSYLFALVAGHLKKLERAYRTAGGRDVTLRLWAEADAIDRCHFALGALERAMRWDERTYGRNYDLSVLNVVATHDFNMGAMENKGLNIFNAKYLLADPDTTTDDEYRQIEAVLGHEYFHNWSGDRVTCRDWFQLSLKEGFTVFREHSFCEDTQSRALQRIADVALLRRVQFAEDAGPLAHPVRPQEYRAIDNFYTTTVYEKGAELIRMLAGKLGRDAFRRGTDRYFQQFDGKAATIEDLIAALGEANDIDLSPYLAWYAQAGTPEVRARDEFDPETRRYRLTLTQHTPPTPGQPVKKPLPIPVKIALFDDDGNALALHRLPSEDRYPGDARLRNRTSRNASAASTDAGLQQNGGRRHRPLPQAQREPGEAAPQATECVVELTAPEQTFVFEDIPARPTPSLLRDFSAPVRLVYDYTATQLALLVRYETSGFDRWNAAQELAARAYDEAFADEAQRPCFGVWLDTLTELFQQRATEEPALLAALLTPPAEAELGARHPPYVPDAVHAARETLESALANRLGGTLARAYEELHAGATGSLDQDAAARRRLQGRVLGLLVRHAPGIGAGLALAQVRTARGMTDRLAGLVALVHNRAPEAAEALRAYRERFDRDVLALDKWFALQASVPAHATLDRVVALESDPAFTFMNPNRVYSLLGAFSRGNPVAFHRPDGAGHRHFAARLAAIDSRNPQLAARLATAFSDWTRLEPVRRASVAATLRQLRGDGQRSPDLAEVLDRMLAADPGST